MRIRIRWLTRIFVGCDVLSFLAQGAGGAMQASKSSGKTKPNAGKEDIGYYLVKGGLVFQPVVFAFSMAVKATFHIRI
ncbi:hypothetical protein FOPG_12814 [Fusarium oxysporum f. sp. conglutinans race 2 54008]|uniref:Uncharacterized protein n=1 Tax=Fusarium oxysporum f. sp. conglutinans race 2 54008 TaxID=1089457 RepID=X0IE04_FUSOX|nr:hypothetical protein FOPG_12814 [Fusarium oxysporum f. sp. conglutinans race 2 54008]